MKIHHIRNNNKLVATLVAIKDEESKTVKVGYSVVMDCDQKFGPTKKDGIVRATYRAMKSRHNKVPPRIKEEFCKFVELLSERREFVGFQLPKISDFEFSYNPIKRNSH